MDKYDASKSAAELNTRDAPCSRDPTQERMQNVLFLLYHHLSHDANAPLLPRLVEVAAAMGPHASRMLRVLTRQLFATHMYKTGKLIARGAYATVGFKLFQEL